MNRLRAGAVLRIPSSGEIAAVSPSEARDEVRRWRAPGLRRRGTSGCRPPAPGAAQRLCRERRFAAPTIRPKSPHCRIACASSKAQLNESKRMLELRNTELADLQAKLAASQQQPARAARADDPPVEQPAAAARSRRRRDARSHGT